MKLTPGLGFGGAVRYTQPLQPIYSLIDGSPTEYDIAPWNPESFTLYASLARSVADSYNADEMQIYAGSDNYQNRVMIQVDDDTNRTMRLRVTKNNTTSLTQDYTLKNRYLPATMKYLITYDGADFSLYLNGLKLMIDDDAIIPTAIEGISVGKDTKGTYGSSASSIDFRYYNQAITDTQARNLSRNTNLIGGLAHDPARRGILCFGQSNIRGRYADDYSTINTGLIKNLRLSGVYENFTEPYSSYASSLFGTSMFQASGVPNDSYMHRVLDTLANDGKEYYTVPSSEWGSGITAGWALYNAGSNADGVMGNLAMATCYRLLQGMQAGTMIAMVNHQGETDAVNATSETNYKAAFTSLINELRAVAGFTLPLVITSLHQWHSGTGASEANWNNINQWRSDLSASIPATIFVNINDLTGRSGDEIHIDAANNATIAARIAAAIQGL